MTPKAPQPSRHLLRGATKWPVIVISLLLVGAALVYFRPGWHSQRAAAVQRHQVSIAVNTSYLGSALVHVAAAKGYFLDAGLDASIQPHSSGQSALNAVLENEADLATVADTPFMFAVLRGHPVSVIATLSVQSKDHGIVARRDKGIMKGADLAAKRIGVPLGTTAHYLLDSVLLAHKLDVRQVELVNLRPEEIEQALLSGRVDAVSIWDPYFNGTNAALGANGTSINADGLYVVTFNVAGRTDFIARNPNAIEQLVRALLRAEDFAKSHPADAQTIVAKATGLAQDTVASNWRGYSFKVGLDQSLVTVLEDQSRWAIRNHYVVQGAVPNFLRSIYPDALNAVHPKAVTVIQ